MAFDEAESGLFGLLTNEPANVFEPMGTALERLGAGCIQGGWGMLFDEPAEPHNRAQRLWPARVEGLLGPLAAWLAQHRRSTHPITARGKNRNAEATRSEAAAELASFEPSMHPDLFHALVEDPYAAAVPPYPDLAPNKFGWRFVKGFFYFHVTVPMHAAPCFLEARKKRDRQRLQVRAFLCKTGGHLLARRAVDALVGDAAFPIL